MDERARLSGRERQILDAVYREGQASARRVMAALPDAPSRAAVRTFLRILEAKGLLKHRVEGREYIYYPAVPRGPAGKSALRRVLLTFFQGSLEKAVAAHVADPRAKLSDSELKRLERLISEARKKGR